MNKELEIRLVMCNLYDPIKFKCIGINLEFIFLKISREIIEKVTSFQYLISNIGSTISKL